MKTKGLLIAFASSLFLAACGQTGADYRPIVDGPEDEYYEQDLASCQEIAERKSYGDGETQTKALGGAAIGGLIGLLTGNTDAILNGALIGGGIGAGSGAFDVHATRERIVKTCMRNRGYRILD